MGIFSKAASKSYRLARVFNDIGKLTSGDPKKILKRAINKMVGRSVFSKFNLK